MTTSVKDIFEVIGSNMASPSFTKTQPDCAG